MANTLTNLIPDLYAALDTVSRELVGLIPAVTLDAQASRVAVGQTLRIPISPVSTAGDITPAVTPPNDGDQTFTNTTVAITKSRRVPIRWNGEEQAGVNSGPGFTTLRQAQFAQGMRALVNEMEADLAALYTQASRAHGSAGTTPFGTAGDYSDMAQVRKILMDNGAPESTLRLVVNTAAGANLRGKQAQVSMVGSDTLLRQGVLQDIHGIPIRESAQIKTHTKGAGTGYLINNGAGYDISTTTLAVDTGTVNTTGIKAGDVLTASGGAGHQYVVNTGLTAASGSVVLNAPGLREAVTNDQALTSLNSYSANLLFAQSAILLVARAPNLPEGGDMADDRMMLTDARSGLSFEISVYRQYRQVQYEIAMAWGVACIKPEYLAILLG